HRGASRARRSGQAVLKRHVAFRLRGRLQARGGRGGGSGGCGGGGLRKMGHPNGGRPFEVLASSTAGASGPFTLRDDVIKFPDGPEARYTVLVNPDSAFIV